MTRTRRTARRQRTRPRGGGRCSSAAARTRSSANSWPSCTVRPSPRSLRSPPWHRARCLPFRGSGCTPSTCFQLSIISTLHACAHQRHHSTLHSTQTHCCEHLRALICVQMSDVQGKGATARACRLLRCCGLEPDHHTCMRCAARAGALHQRGRAGAGERAAHQRALPGPAERGTAQHEGRSCCLWGQGAGCRQGLRRRLPLPQGQQDPPAPLEGAHSGAWQLSDAMTTP